MKTAYGYLKENPSARIFSIGGGCDADVPVISHLNKLYDGNLFVLWLDAHGDLNSPEESKTGLFYGMPARILIDGRDIFPDIIERPLMPHQIIHIGGRDFDKPELGYIKKNNIQCISSVSTKHIKDALNEKQRSFIYIHLDLDILSPEEFPNTPLPVNGGATKKEILKLIENIKNNYLFAGFGLYEYAPCGKKSEFIKSIFDIMMTE